MKLIFYGQFLFHLGLNENFQLYHMDFFFEGIVGVTPLNPILTPLIQSLGNLSLERVLPMLCILAQVTKT
jgi:hypothetical protein